MRIQPDTSYIVQAIVETSDYYSILLYITITEKVVVCMGAYFTVIIYACVCVCACGFFVLRCSIIRLMTLTSIFFLIPPNMFSTIIFQLCMTSFHVFPENVFFFSPAITLMFDVYSGRNDVKATTLVDL